MKKSIDYAEQLRNELYDLSDVLVKEGKSYAECRQAEIMCTLLSLTLHGQRVIRSLLSSLFGLALGFLLRLLLRGN